MSLLPDGLMIRIENLRKSSWFNKCRVEQRADVRAMARWVLLFVFAVQLAVPESSWSQSTSVATVSGHVVDSESGDGLPGAVVRFLNQRQTVLSGTSGAFQFRGPIQLPDTLTVRLLGYRPLILAIQAEDIPSSGWKVAMERAPIALDAITISATREERLGNELPEAIDRIGGDLIAASNPAHPSRIANRIPGVWINATEGEGHMTSIRQPLSLLPQYLYLENGIPTRSTGFFNHNALFEVNIPQASSIEVIKGPGTALHGSDAIGGVINVETGSIPSESGGSILGETGSFGFKRALFTVSSVGDQDGYRLDVNVADSDGWRRGTAYNRQSATLAWRRSLGPASRLHTVATATRVEQHPAGIAAISTEDYEADPRTHYTPISFRNVSAFRLSSAWSKWAGSSLFSVTPYFRYSAMDLLPNWALTFDPAIWETSNWSVGAQARWHWFNRSENVRTIVGLDAEISPGKRREIEVEANRVASIFVDYERAGNQYDYDVTFQQIAPFVHAEWTPVERLRATAGLRFDLAGYDYENHLGLLESGRHKRPASQRTTYSQFSPKAGLTYEVAQGLTAVASYRHAFRVPSERQVFRQGSARSSIGLKPVRANNFETGIRWNSLDTFALEVTGYVLVKDNDIVTFNYEEGSRGSVNTGQTRHQGIESGLTLRPHTLVSGSVAWTIARHSYEAWITDLDQNFSGNEMELAPRHLVHAEVVLRPPGSIEGEMAISWHRVGSYWMNPDNTVRYDGHNLVHLRWNMVLSGRWTVLGRVGNLGDTLYAQRALTNAFRGDEWAPGLPRNINVALRAQF
jgi:outer membrane receptor protein involved in Fe transport